MAKNGYKTMNLPMELVEEMKVWKMAFSVAYGRSVSYGEMIRVMLDSLEDTEPGVVGELGRLLEKHPELQEKMANYKGEADENDK